MTQKKALFCVLCIVNVLFLCAFFAFKGLNWALILSYEVAFFSTLLAILSSYLHYKKNILIKSSKFNYEPKPLALFIKKIPKNSKIINFKHYNDDLVIKFKDKFKNFSLFFSLFKLLAYGILVGGFLFLQRQNLLFIAGYLGGISAFLVGIFAYMLCVKNE
ncbi:hypothetical protein AAIL08_000403 [Campylobacter upsaliensis]|uniref:hypothetical protein n=1 Tax=Campylobacter upsaliensis TaxID=28080 RepID=UPI001271F2E4|nr:hypothetical protein [Campylobacter upsaliensis]EAH6863295.1 hypothetical protein [Campylobacter upsaliensis]EAH7597404.1 hypothetical protein [Campylobacter upsaliensis]EAH9850348.1 hypothetical protein [Campylobacter upsaliensis]EAI3921117.1 hypothetical protein [Campylobacter upsaliensis]EAI5397407.1 hypothetical protein [Campylobacter upsaliensis]